MEEIDGAFLATVNGGDIMIVGQPRSIQVGNDGEKTCF